MKNRRTWKAQLKLNGQRNLVFISPEGEIQYWNRHGGPHLNWNSPVWLDQQVRDTVRSNGKWIVLDGELLHAKDADIKNTLCWWDVLVCDGEYLVGTKLSDRRQMLLDLLPHVDGQFIGKITDNIWLSQDIEAEQYDEAWAETEISWVEGLVFKDYNAKLMPCIGEKNNGTWQVRCRKPHKAYRF
jgi:ATP-dependent DNA ligase